MALHRKPLQHKTERCRWCGGKDHRSFNCFSRPRKPLKKESKAAMGKRHVMAYWWFNENPPNTNGNWVCYLQITKACPKLLTRHTVQLEHVFPRAKYPELRYCVENIKPSCEFCNKEKGKNTITQVALLFPRIASMIETPEWMAWESEVLRLVKHEPRPDI